MRRCARKRGGVPEHGRLLFRDGHWVICDLGSTNGTMVDGVRIGRCRLHAGDRVISATLRSRSTELVASTAVRSAGGSWVERNVETGDSPAHYEAMPRLPQTLGNRRGRGPAAAFRARSLLVGRVEPEDVGRSAVRPAGLDFDRLHAVGRRTAHLRCHLAFRQAGKGWPQAVPLVSLALLVTAAACVYGFLVWFTRHNCGGSRLRSAVNSAGAVKATA